MKDSPKILLGCSDITTLHCLNLLNGGTISFHGPMPQSLVEPECPDFTWQKLLSALRGDGSALGSLSEGYPHASETVQSLRKGRVTARLVGGNLTVMGSLIGTPYFPSLDGNIFFFEDIGETPFRIDRCLTQMLNVGLLQSAAGFALGLFKDCEYRPSKPGEPVEYRQSLKDVIIDRLAPLGKPIVMGLPFGHVPFNATIPVGGLATLDGGKGTLMIEELGVR
jgi:muramoyltetrapeptide carboxypeptidase